MSFGGRFEIRAVKNGSSPVITAIAERSCRKVGTTAPEPVPTAGGFLELLERFPLFPLLIRAM